MTLPLVRALSLACRSACCSTAVLIVAVSLFLATAPASAAMAAPPQAQDLAQSQDAARPQDSAQSQDSAQPQDSAVVVYLVRHAEKADDGTDDPPLAVAGQIRVWVLRALLADADLTHVHTTDWKRTRETAVPIADAAGLEPVLYDPQELEDVAAEIEAMPGRHLVVGHSNTTPQLAAALGGDPSGPIQELEYDRLYIVTIVPGRSPLTTLLRFGEPFVAGEDFGLRASRQLARPRAATAGREGN